MSKCIYSHDDGAYCDKHSHGAVTMSCYDEENCPDRKVLTNADKIRAMTDEELADEYIRIYHRLGWYTDSWAWLRKWLKSPVKEEE